MGVALVASAAKSLTFSTCKDTVTMIINAVAAVVSFYYPVTWYPPPPPPPVSIDSCQYRY